MVLDGRHETGANTVTATFPSNPQHDIYVYEMSGLTAGAADIAATGTSAAGNSTATFTTTAANDFIVVQTVNLGAPAPPAGYTLRISGTAFQRSWTKDDPTAAGSVANTETGGGGGSLSAVAFTIVGGATRRSACTPWRAASPVRRSRRQRRA
jgi:hypothetical protein